MPFKWRRRSSAASDNSTSSPRVSETDARHYGQDEWGGATPVLPPPSARRKSHALGQGSALEDEIVAARALALSEANEDGNEASEEVEGTAMRRLSAVTKDNDTTSSSRWSFNRRHSQTSATGSSPPAKSAKSRWNALSTMVSAAGAVSDSSESGEPRCALHIVASIVVHSNFGVVRCTHPSMQCMRRHTPTKSQEPPDHHQPPTDAIV
jgi:hypothetical protein